MRRLYLQFYVWILAILVIFVVAVGVLWRVATHEGQVEDTLAFAGELATRALPPGSAAPAQQQDALEQFHRRLGFDLSLYAPDGRLIAAAGRLLPPPPPGHAEPGFVRGPPREAWLVRLNDGRVLMARLPGGPRRP